MTVILHSGNSLLMDNSETIEASLQQGFIFCIHGPEKSGACYLDLFQSIDWREQIEDLLGGIEEQDMGALRIKIIGNSCPPNARQKLKIILDQLFLKDPTLLLGNYDSIDVRFSCESGNLAYKKHDKRRQFHEKLEFSDPHSSIILIGASTGGTQAIESILGSFSPPIPPIVIAQHIGEGFSQHFAERLGAENDFNVLEVKSGECLEVNHVYVAPGGRHLKIINLPNGDLGTVLIDDEHSDYSPSVNILFKSFPRIPHLKVVACLLTGIGEDGSEGLLKLRNEGAHTIAQDESSSLVYGMPKVAAELGAAIEKLHINKIPDAITRECNKISDQLKDDQKKA